ncbi:reverse transcriptase [Tanacetum coccineum]
MASSHQQSIADAGSENKPPMLEKGSYVLWASRSKRYVDGKKEHGRIVKDSIENDITGNDKLRYEVDIDAMNWILLGIPNDIYNSIDVSQNAKAMWNRVKRLMHGTDLSLQEKHSRLMNEFNKFSGEVEESLKSVYEIFSMLMNNMERNKLLLEKIAINTNKNAGYVGNGSSNDRRNAGNQGNNAGNIQCFNYNEKGHYARDCSKPTTRDSKYFREQMLIATKDEAGIHLDDEENDFMLMSAIGDD